LPIEEQAIALETIEQWNGIRFRGNGGKAEKRESRQDSHIKRGSNNMCLKQQKLWRGKPRELATICLLPA